MVGLRATGSGFQVLGVGLRVAEVSVSCYMFRCEVSVFKVQG